MEIGGWMGMVDITSFYGYKYYTTLGQAKRCSGAQHFYFLSVPPLRSEDSRKCRVLLVVLGYGVVRSLAAPRDSRVAMAFPPVLAASLGILR